MELKGLHKLKRTPTVSILRGKTTLALNVGFGQKFRRGFINRTGIVVRHCRIHRLGRNNTRIGTAT